MALEHDNGTRLDAEHDLLLSAHIRHLLLDYVHMHITIDHVQFGRQAASELALLEPVPLHDPTSLTLPSDPFQTLANLHRLDFGIGCGSAVDGGPGPRRDADAHVNEWLKPKLERSVVEREMDQLEPTPECLQLVERLIALMGEDGDLCPRSERALASAKTRRDCVDETASSRTHVWPLSQTSPLTYRPMSSAVLSMRAQRQTPHIVHLADENSKRPPAKVPAYRALVLQETRQGQRLVCQDVTSPATLDDDVVNERRVLELELDIRADDKPKIMLLMKSIMVMPKGLPRTERPEHIPSSPLPSIAPRRPHSPPFMPIFPRRPTQKAPSGKKPKSKAGHEKLEPYLPASFKEVPALVQGKGNAVTVDEPELHEENMVVVDGWQTLSISPPSSIEKGEDDEIDQLFLESLPDMDVSIPLAEEIEKSKLEEVLIPRNRRIGGSSSVDAQRESKDWNKRGGSFASFIGTALSSIPLRTANGELVLQQNEKDIRKPSLPPCVVEMESDASSMIGQPPSRYGQVDEDKDDSEILRLYGTENMGEDGVMEIIRKEKLLDDEGGSRDLTKMTHFILPMDVPALPPPNIRPKKSETDLALPQVVKDLVKPKPDGPGLTKAKGLASLRVSLSWVTFTIPASEKLTHASVLGVDDGVLSSSDRTRSRADSTIGEQSVVDAMLKKAFADDAVRVTGVDAWNWSKFENGKERVKHKGQDNGVGRLTDTIRCEIILTRAERKSLEEKQSRGPVQGHHGNDQDQTGAESGSIILEEERRHTAALKRKEHSFFAAEDEPASIQHDKRPRLAQTRDDLIMPPAQREADLSNGFHDSDGFYCEEYTDMLCPYNDTYDDEDEDKENRPPPNMFAFVDSGYMTDEDDERGQESNGNQWVEDGPMPGLQDSESFWNTHQISGNTSDSESIMDGHGRFSASKILHGDKHVPPEASSMPNANAKHSRSKAESARYALNDAKEPDVLDEWITWNGASDGVSASVDNNRGRSVLPGKVKDGPDAHESRVAPLEIDSRFTGVDAFAQLRARKIKSVQPILVCEALPDKPQDPVVRNKNVPQDLYDSKTLRLDSSLSPPKYSHKYMCSLDVLQKQVLVRCLRSPQCMVTLAERESLDGVDLIIDPYSAVIFVDLFSLPSRREVLISRVSTQSWRYKALLIVFEAYPASLSYQNSKKDNDTSLFAYSPPVVKAIKKFRRDLDIAEACGNKAGTCQVRYAFADSVADAALYARYFGDLAEGNTHPTNQAVWEGREWLDLDESEEEAVLASFYGMNRFSASIILCRVQLQECIEMSLQDMLDLFGAFIDSDILTACKMDMDRRVSALEEWEEVMD